MQNKVIALDADGVLLDYNLAYAYLWEKVYGVFPEEKNPDAYWNKDRWDIRRLSGSEAASFHAHFNESFWSSIPLMPGATEACQMLIDAGYELVCVSAISRKFQKSRLINFRNFELPISQVIATENDFSVGNPKLAALKSLSPDIFVDDFLPCMKDVPSSIHCALIDRNPYGSPNFGCDLSQIQSKHSDILEFSKWWLDR